MMTATRLLGRLPAAEWLRGYSAATGRTDLLAGLSLAAFVIPESLAYASLADLPPVTGLYCYLFGGIAYALFGTSRQLAVGPTSSLAIAIAAGVAAITGDPAHFLALGSALALIVGLVSLGGRYIGLANVAYFISDPILLGFKTGAALYIASTQLPKLFGVHGTSGNFFERLGHLATQLPQTHLASLLFGLTAIALFIGFERALPGRPTTLVVVASAIAVTAIFNLGAAGIHIVGELPSGLPPVGLPAVTWSEVSALLPVAFACFLLAYGETISVARSFAQKHGYDIRPEQELSALGAANLATGLGSGFPVAGGMSQTAVNDMGGAATPAALVVTSAAIALTLLFLSHLFRNLPEPVLGAIVLMAASHLLRLRDVHQLRFVSRPEFLISLLAMGGVLFFGLLDGLLLAAGGSLLMLIAHASRPPVVVLARDPVSGRFVNEARYPDSSRDAGALVIRGAGAWVYFNAEHIRRRVVELVEAQPDGCETVVLDFSIVPVIDITASEMLLALTHSLRRRGIALALAELRDDVAQQLKLAGVEEDLGPIAAHLPIETCLPPPRGGAAAAGSC